METIGELIDKLITANLKVWHYLEKEDAESMRKMKTADIQRHKLIEELDQRLGEKTPHQGLKTYEKSG